MENNSLLSKWLRDNAWPILITVLGVAISATVIRTQVLANSMEIVELKKVLRQVTNNQTQILLIQQKNKFTDAQLEEISENIKDIKKTLNIK